MHFEVYHIYDTHTLLFLITENKELLTGEIVSRILCKFLFPVN